MKIPEHDIIDCKWLIARATFAAKPRQEERDAAAEELLKELAELNGAHGIIIERQVNALRVQVPDGAEKSARYESGAFRVEGAPVAIQYDAGLRMFVGPQIADAPPGRNGARPRVSAMVTLLRALLGEAAEVR